jgi:hypothetical protein
MTTEPRSIWYVEALVIVSPMYIVLVPMMSHHAWSGKGARRWARVSGGGRGEAPGLHRGAGSNRPTPCSGDQRAAVY